MKVYCSANLDNDLQIQNLCQCIEIVGAKPQIHNCEVSVEYSGNKTRCELLIEIFEHYSRHSIFTLETNPI